VEIECYRGSSGGSEEDARGRRERGSEKDGEEGERGSEEDGEEGGGEDDSEEGGREIVMKWMERNEGGEVVRRI
jgi:hypothetical protein